MTFKGLSGCDTKKILRTTKCLHDSETQWSVKFSFSDQNRLVVNFWFFFCVGKRSVLGPEKVYNLYSDLCK